MPSAVIVVALCLAAVAAAAPSGDAVTNTIEWFDPEFDPLQESLTSFAHGPLVKQTTQNAKEYLHAIRGHNVSFEQKVRREATESVTSGGPVLEGLYIWGCQPVGILNGNPNMPISRFDTRLYAINGKSTPGLTKITYTIDRTYYVGDPDCKPDASDVLYKTVLHGIHSGHGPNPLDKFKDHKPTVYKGELDWNGGSVFVSNVLDKKLIDLLNDQCPCDGTWKFDELRPVTQKDCKQTSDTAPTLCRILAGTPEYYNFAYTSDNAGYVTSKDDFDQTTGWGNDLLEDYVRVKIPPSYHDDPNDCDYKVWDSCGTEIQNAQVACEQCDDDLEDDGCLFRELEPNWEKEKQSGPNYYKHWHYCCPCIHKFADKYDHAWMHTLC